MTVINLHDKAEIAVGDGYTLDSKDVLKGASEVDWHSIVIIGINKDGKLEAFTSCGRPETFEIFGRAQYRLAASYETDEDDNG